MSTDAYWIEGRVSMAFLLNMLVILTINNG